MGELDPIVIQIVIGGLFEVFALPIAIFVLEKLIGATAPGAAQIAVYFDGAPLLETTMISQTGAAGDLNNVNRKTSVNTCCCNGGAITVVNTGTTEMTIGANPILYIGRRA